MAKKQKPAFYAVARGRKIGIYNTWAECEAQVKGVSGARHKSFMSRKDAEEFLEAQHRDYKDPQLHSINSTVSNPTREELLAEYADEGLLLSGYLDDGRESAIDLTEDNNFGSTKPQKRQRTMTTKEEEKSDGFLSFDSSQGGVERISPTRRYFEWDDAPVTSSRVQRQARSVRNARTVNMMEQERDETLSPANTTKKDSVRLIECFGKGVRTIEVYTDGAASRNGTPTSRAGYGVYWPESEDPQSDLHGLNRSERVPGHPQTNNRAELMGILRAVQLCPDPDAQLVIYTDSKYSLQAMNEWQAKWRKNKWINSMGQPVMNKDLIRLLERELRKKRRRPALIHVKGHSINEGNQHADRLAVEGAQKPDVPPDQCQDLEPSDSEEEDANVMSQKAIAAWEKMGFTKEEAKVKAGVRTL